MSRAVYYYFLWFMSSYSNGFSYHTGPKTQMYNYPLWAKGSDFTLLSFRQFFLLLGLCEVTERGCQQYGYLRHRTLPGVSDGQPIITKNRFLRPYSETWQPSRWADHLFQHHITTRSSTKRWDWLVDQCLRDYSNSSKQLKNSTLESCISNR